MNEATTNIDSMLSTERDMTQTPKQMLRKNNKDKNQTYENVHSLIGVKKR